jgi:prolyl-tRNA editing enzyme YbaK/EbsC (Cys-tRNA(Pro) deacylase)
MTLFESLCTLLREKNIPFRTVHHEPTFTSEESAKARGEEVKIGGKAIVMKADDSFALFVVSASLKVDSKKIKALVNAKSVRFASKEELFELTGLVPGSVPPFGRPLLPFDVYIDTSVTRNEKIAFNAGSLTDSIIMSTKEYLLFSGGSVHDFAQ